MSDPWVAVDATVRRNAKLAALSSDSARWGWLVMLGEAKLLRQSGTFSPGQWPESMGRLARFLKEYLEHGLLHRAPTYCSEAERCLRGRGPFPDGTIVVHDWLVHQREHAVRQVTYRETHPKVPGDVPSDSPSDVESDVKSDTPSRALSSSSVESPSSGSPGKGSGGNPFETDAARIQVVVSELTGRFFSMASKNGDRLERWMKRHGYAKVEATLREVSADLGGLPEQVQLINSTENYLYPAVGSKVIPIKSKGYGPDPEVLRNVGR